jgi:DNA mismatch repair protein MutH
MMRHGIGKADGGWATKEAVMNETGWDEEVLEQAVLGTKGRVTVHKDGWLKVRPKGSSSASSAWRHHTD